VGGERGKAGITKKRSAENNSLVEREERRRSEGVSEGYLRV